MPKFERLLSVLGPSLFALSALGCGAEMPEDLDGIAGSGSGESVASTTEALMQCKYENLKFYTFDTPLRQRIGTGTPSNTLCWLNNIAGSPLQGKPDMSVTSDSKGWYVTGPMNSVVKVACAPLDCFYANELPQDVKWASLPGSATSPDASGAAPFGGLCASGTSGGWMADSAIIFQGLEMGSGTSHGAMLTTKDVAKTIQPESSRQYTSASLTDCYDDGGTLKMFYSNIFVGVPGGGHRPVFMGPLSSGTYGITAAGEYVAKSWDSSHYTEMRPVDDGICYLASVSGNLKTTDDFAEVFAVYKQYEKRYRWVLRAEKLSGSNNSTFGVKATARCYKYKQAQY